MTDMTFEADDRGYVYAIARRIVGSPEDAEDVTQEALLLAFRHRSTYRGEAQYRTWLYRIAVTTALSHLRRCRRSRIQLNGDEVFEHVVDPAKSAEDITAEAEECATVQQAIDQLPAAYREVLLARTAEETEAEVARRLSISVANVKIRTHRARKQLRAHLERVAA